jgi:outer membrane cobalamin receptor
VFTRALLAICLLAVTLGAPATALAGSFEGAAGTVVSTDGTPIAGAIVSLSGNGPVKRATSDAKGHFEFAILAPGVYLLGATATGFGSLSGRAVAVREHETTVLQVVLSRQQVSSLTVIGEVRSNGGAVLSTASAPVVQINAQTYAAQGVNTVSDILQNEVSTTVVPVLGGGLNAPEVVALRGPDPSETLVDVDGHSINNGNTGDFDLSLLDPADLQSVEVVYGIAPSSLFGPNTLGGALNVRTLEPTQTPETLLRVSGGSYDTWLQTLQATGTDGRFGYAFSLHRMTSGGQLDDYAFPVTTTNAKNVTTISGYAPIGNDMTASSAIAKLRYSFGNGGFIGFTFRDQSVNRDLSATLSAGPPSGGSLDDYENFSGTSTASTNSAYDLDLQLPLGNVGAGGIAATTMTFRHQTALIDQSVAGPGTATSPYLYNDRDLINDDTLEFDHELTKGSLSLKFALTNESLSVNDFIPGVIYADAVHAPNMPTFVPPGITPATVAFDRPAAADAAAGDSATAPQIQQLGQTQRWVGARYELDPTSKLHYQFAAYYSDFSSFGHSLDPRFGFVWTPTADSAVRASAGSTFQSPQLPTFIVPGVLPPPVASGSGFYVNLGNPNATAEHSTEYDVGFEHYFRIPQHQVHVSLDLYRTDLHDGVATFFTPGACPLPTKKNPAVCLSYPVNVTQEVYQGMELKGDVALAPHTNLHAAYDVDSVYTQAAPPDALDGVTLNEQSLGVPLHKFNLQLEHNGPQVSYYAGMLYEGYYNELNLAPFATVRAGVTWHIRGVDLGLYGENLTNTYNFLTTRAGGGIIYDGGTTDALPLAGRQIRIVITHKS